MSAVPCVACGGKMSAAAKVCPHCGTRAAPAGMGDVKMSSDEARALLTMHDPHVPGAERTVASYLLPHPRTSGAAAAAEQALTVVTAPLWSCGLVAFAWSRMRYRSGSQIAMGEGKAAAVLGACGAAILWPLAMVFTSGTVATAITVAMGVAWLARALIRVRADERGSRALSELDRPAPPVARAPAPAPPSAPFAPPRLEPTASAAPEATEAAPLGDGPRHLR